jgi:hypothetical protein
MSFDLEIWICRKRLAAAQTITDLTIRSLMTLKGNKL